MDRIAKICREVQELSRTELATFRQWFHEFDTQAWDQPFEKDIQGGKLNSGEHQVLEDIPLFKPKTEN